MVMDSDREHAANAGQTEFWNSESGQRWVTHQEALDQRLAPLTDALMERAGIRPGEAVIDVGCGAGTTTLQLAGAVGAHGSVLGDRHLGAAARGGAPARSAGRLRQRTARPGGRPDPQVRARVPRPRGVALRRDVLRRSGRRLRQPGERAAPGRASGLRQLGRARGESLVRAAARGRRPQARAAGAAAAACARSAGAERTGLHRRDPDRRRVCAGTHRSGRHASARRPEHARRKPS